MKKVGIIMGSDSDLPVVQKAVNILREFEVPFEVHVYSAHRTPVEARDFAVNARQNGFGAIIAAAGMAAHLAGAMAAGTTLPVIGIPIKSAGLGGIDALLSTVQMPTGLPVATVAIDGAANAALLAVQILAVEDAVLAKKLDDNVGARHAKAIYDDISESGTLDESKLNIKSEGFLMAGLRAPMALRLMRVGKMNPLDKHKVNPEIETIRKIVKNAEAAAKEAE